MPEFLEIGGITKRYGPLVAVDNVSVSIRKGEFFSLLGPSGCGKTTLLRMIAGFEFPDDGDRGTIFLDGKNLLELPAYERPVNTIFQNYALFPHLTVWENIAFGLRVARTPRAEMETQVRDMLRLVQMEEHAHKKPHQISGGQKQRVAIARALVLKPQVLLLDEPLAALDLKLRQKMLIELDMIHDVAGITFIYVTHDQTEAMSISDRIAVMNRGRIEQIGSPVELYEAPRTSFVAAFIGDTNFFDGTIAELLPPDRCRLCVSGLPDAVCFNDKNLGPGGRVHLSIRPEKFHISRDRPEPKANHNVLPAVVEDVIYFGDRTKYWVRAGEHRVAVSQQHSRYLLDEKPIRWKEPVFVSWHADDGFMLEQYSASDETLRELPPDEVARRDAGG